MSCIAPLDFKVKDKYGKYKIINVPCGHCLNCMIKKQSQIEFLAKKELIENYQSGKSASFVTLTYDDNHIPKNDEGFLTLKREDLQKFIKRMRRNMDYHKRQKDFKILYCGEYGDGSHSTTKTGVSTCRPHYHIVFIGLSPEEVKYYTRKLWNFGLCDIGPLGAGGIRYLCKYMTKAIPEKEVKELREVAKVQNPFFYHSVGLAKSWINKNLDKIVENNFCFNANGKITPFPKYVCKYVSMHTGTPYVNAIKTFISNTELQEAHAKGMLLSDFQFEKSYIAYKYKVAALRSQNKPINDITLSKKWCKPKSYNDRVPLYDTSMLDLAYNYGKYGDVVPF